jgi:exodeoxyribonuclease V gamma subunit
VLHLHRAERADVLADALTAILAEPPADPFAAEVVSVPTRGMERWLTQRMSARLGAGPEAGRRDGVCANVAFPFPGRLVGGALAAASGIDPDRDPWLRERLVWPLLAVVDDSLAEPWLAGLAAHLEAGSRERRFARIRQIADLYDTYAVRRPGMLQAWARGEDLDGSGAPLPHAGAWQAELWRALRQAIGVPSGPERLEPACARLRADPGVCALPERLALFGVTRLPDTYVRVLGALAAGREIHVFLLHPSPDLWRAVAAATAGGPAIRARALDPTPPLAAHRLLASWGRDSRELQLVLDAAGGEAAEHHHSLPDEAADTLLRRIQADVRANRPPPGPPLPAAADERLDLSPADRSLQVHACHGPARQVEALREAILHTLRDDPTLEPRDVIVMCPDIETFAPLIEATFGTAAEPDLRVRLADRSLRATNPLLELVASLLELAEARVSASQVLDLADSDVVRRRFGFDDDDLARLHDWVVASGIHWGLDATRRSAYRLQELSAGTWEAGLTRVLLGVTMSESDRTLYERVLPVDDVESGAIELAGRFAELVDRLALALDTLAGPHTVPRWAEAILAATESLGATSEADAWQGYELRRLLEEVATEGTGIVPSAELALPEVRALLAGRLAGRPTRANFRTGHLTICTLVPMRSVPHRVVCLLGLDDGAFPRRSPRDGDDLLLDDPHVGDRDPRTEDRQMLLDALLAAGERLIVTYSGNDERMNAVRPAAVPVGELLDIVDATARVASDPACPASRLVRVRHPLQAFDERNFLAGRLVAGGSWSFDRVALEGALALRGERTVPGPLVPVPLPPVERPVLELTDLVRFVERPVRAFLRQRLGISTTDTEDEVSDALPVELDALEQWGIGQRLLEALLAGIESRTAIVAEIARGTLPPGELARPVIARVWPTVDLIAGHARAYGGSDEPRSVECNVHVPDGPLLTGTVSGVRGHVLLSVTYSRLSARHRIAAWVRLLALTAAHPGEPFEAVTVGRARSGAEFGDVSVARIQQLGRDPEARRARALAQLRELIDLHARGMREPLPIPCLTAAAYATALVAGRDPEAAETAAEGAWKSGWRFDREDREPEHLAAFGGELALAELLEPGARADEAGEGWAQGERSRFGRYALRLWTPLLARETVEEL